MEIRDTSSMRLDASVGVLSCYCCFRARGMSRAHEYLCFSAVVETVSVPAKEWQHPLSTSHQNHGKLPSVSWLVVSRE